MAIRFTEALAAEYSGRYDSCEIRTERFAEVDRVADAVVASKSRYEAAAGGLGIPWFFVGGIHNLESSLRVDRHLHNGDPLTGRTVHVPPGRPPTGNPPFTWEESAADALTFERLDRVDDWSLPRLLYEAEKYNGWGYRRHHPEVLSPYLWSFTNHYEKGKYVADGRWSETAVSRQCGFAAVIRRLEERTEIPPLAAHPPSRTFFRFSRISAEKSRVVDLQRFLNTFDGIRLRVDGAPGPKTSAAVERIFGAYLEGDPRNEE